MGTGLDKPVGGRGPIIEGKGKGDLAKIFSPGNANVHKGANPTETNWLSHSSVTKILHWQNALAIGHSPWAIVSMRWA